MMPCIKPFCLVGKKSKQRVGKKIGGAKSAAVNPLTLGVWSVVSNGLVERKCLMLTATAYWIVGELFAILALLALPVILATTYGVYLRVR